MNDSFPSLKTRPDPPFGWIQWKGTSVCMDIHCECGALTHIDAEFCYHVKCCVCGRVYECGGHVRLYPLDHTPEGVQESH